MLNNYIEKVADKLNSMLDVAASLTPNVIIAIIFLCVVYVFSKLVKSSIINLLKHKPQYISLAKIVSRLASISINI